MTYSFSKPIIYAFVATAIFYLASVSFIQYPITTVLKPIPIICLLLGVLQSVLIPWTKRLQIMALGFSLAGDIILTLPISLALELGIGFFLLAQCCYITLFVKSFYFRMSRCMYYLPVLLCSGVLAFILIPHMGAMLIPVLIYFSVLLIMVFTAFQVHQSGMFFIFGALNFLISDSILAVNLFLNPHWNVKIIVMLTYYTAQLLLTWGLVILYKKRSKLEVRGLISSPI